MVYEYSGYLKGLLEAPDPVLRDSLPCVVFSTEDIAQWSLSDLPGDPEWQHIPATSRRTEHGIRIEGRFNAVHQIDNLSADDPSFWVSLSSLTWADDRFPVDVARYPIVEITYRCTSPNARPAWLWTYPGGMHFDGLTPTQEWRTIARCASQLGFPARVDAIILRLFSTVRGTESFEVESIRFREMSAPEAEACQARQVRIERESPPKRYPVLDTFLPLGCYMDAGSAKRLAAMLGISFQEYWDLTFEDMAKHHHNCVALEQIDRLTREEWSGLLTQAESYGVKFFAIHQLPLGSPRPYCREFIENHIKPHADSPSILAWSLHDEPPEHGFEDVVQARALVESVDAQHPMGVMLRNPNAFALFASSLPICGIAHYASHVPWQTAELVRTHLPLARGQQFWVVAPGFIYATDTPEWHSAPEMRMMMNHALANGARGWFTFAFHNDPIWTRGSCQRSLTGPFLTFSDLWSELGHRAEHCNALAPLLLSARPEPSIEQWFGVKTIARPNTQIPEGMPPASVTRLCGADYELYCLVSNGIREMATVLLDVTPDAVRGLELYDLSDYFWTRQWRRMDLTRHLEMFPGQMHCILAATPEVCAHWRDRIAERLIENAHRYISFDLALVRAYGIEITDIEKLVEGARNGAGPQDLETMWRARDLLTDRVYDTPAIHEPRSRIIEASAAVCACDGCLCRLLDKGKGELAHHWGLKVIPLAREFTNLRLDLRRGKGAAILEQCGNLARRATALLAEIRSIR